MYGTSYSRPARAYPDVVPSMDITIAPPPTINGTDSGMSWLTYMLPVLGSLGSIAFVFIYHNRLMMIMAVAITLLSFASGFAMWFQQHFMVRRMKKVNREKYQHYLEEQESHLTEIATKQMNAARFLYPSTLEFSRLLTERQRVWERRSHDDDFLHVSIGHGKVRFRCNVQVNVDTNPLIEYERDLVNQVQGLVGRYQRLDGLPVTISLPSVNALGVYGPDSVKRAFTRSLLCQIALLQAPGDVQFMVFAPEGSQDEWSWFKWLPHGRRGRSLTHNSNRDSISLLVNHTEDFRELFQTLVEPRIQQAKRVAESDKFGAQEALSLPHLILIFDSYSYDAIQPISAELEELWKYADQAHISVISLVDHLRDEPTTLKARVHVDERGNLAYEEMAYGGVKNSSIQLDVLSVGAAEQVARSLAPLQMVNSGRASDLSETVRFSDLLGISFDEDLRMEDWWLNTTVTENQLRVPIGEGADGKTLTLDLKEAAAGGMGPHGLIVGATGSGKSELMRTIVTGLAAHHAPDLLNFVFVDFKGGAAFADFSDLPHCAGSITNIENDLTLVDRMKEALYGEQKRRQRLLREAGNLDSLQQYQEKRRANLQMEPMPYLLVIVDEFGELLANRPDFLNLFVAIGRVGRSIGMHLLLATQRLDEGRIRGLEGHLRYRICLRTFTVDESVAMLGKQDAYYLPSYPGVGYFKVDTNTYDLFKTAMVSTPVREKQDNEIAATAVRTVAESGRYLQTSAEPNVKDRVDDVSRFKASEMDVLIEQCRIVAQLQPVQIQKVWLPPLPTHLTLGEVVKESSGRDFFDGQDWPSGPMSGSLRSPVGLLDIPANQEQVPLVLDLSGIRGHLAVVGASQTGKSTLLRTVITSFALTHTPAEVQFYIIDLGGGTLRALTECPHVGAVCGKSDRERILQLIHQVQTVIEEREHFFRDTGLDSMASYRELRRNGQFADSPYGDVILVIDDISQLQGEWEVLEPAVIEIVTTGLNYGVHVIVTANRWADIRPKIRDNMGGRLELRLNDAGDSVIGRTNQTGLAEGLAGRGLTQEGMHFQVALPDELDAVWRNATLLRDSDTTLFSRMRLAWKGSCAPPLRVLPGRILLTDVQGIHEGPGVGIAIGIENTRLSPVYIDLLTGDPHFLLYGDGETGKSNLLGRWIRGLAESFTEQDVQIIVVDYRRTLLDFVDVPNLFGYACTPAMVQESIGRLAANLDVRMQRSANLTLEELRRSWSWEGPHYIVIVDDYDWVVPAMGAAANPLAPLLEYILQGRDIGLHLLLARRVGGASRSAFEPLLQRLREMGTPGLILNGDAQEGPLILHQRAGSLPVGRGYLVRRNHKTLQVQTFLMENIRPS